MSSTVRALGPRALRVLALAAFALVLAVLACAGPAPQHALAAAAEKVPTPTIAKHVLEDSDDSWVKGADATAGDELLWRGEVTVYAKSLNRFATEGRTYALTVHDVFGSQLDVSRVLSTLHVYVRAGTDGSWDDASGHGSAGSAGTPQNGWSELASPAVTLEGRKLTVSIPDLVSTMGELGLDTAGGAQICLVYDAPISGTARSGVKSPKENRIWLDYSTLTKQGEETHTTPEEIAWAYTWSPQLVKRDADGNALSGAVFRITDDRGRHLNGAGKWVSRDATVTTGEDGTVRMERVDSGTYRVEEVAAPKGYERVSKDMSITIEVGGIDAASLTAESITFDPTATEPLEEVRSLRNERKGRFVFELVNETSPNPEPNHDDSTPGHKGGSADTGDYTPMLAAALLGMAALAMALAAARRRRRDSAGGDGR